MLLNYICIENKGKGDVRIITGSTNYSDYESHTLGSENDTTVKVSTSRELTVVYYPHSSDYYDNTISFSVTTKYEEE